MSLNVIDSFTDWMSSRQSCSSLITIQIYTDLYSIFYLIVQYIYIYLIDSIDSIDSIDRAIISESISINQLRLWKVGSCHVPAAPQLNFWRWYPLVTHGKPSALIGKTCTNGTFHYGNLWHKETSNMANKRSVLDAAWCPSDSQQVLGRAFQGDKFFKSCIPPPFIGSITSVVTSNPISLDGSTFFASRIAYVLLTANPADIHICQTHRTPGSGAVPVLLWKAAPLQSGCISAPPWK